MSLRHIILLFSIVCLAGCAAGNQAVPTPAPEPTALSTTTPTAALAAVPNLDQAGPVQIAGRVLSGGDTTPAGLKDAPRKFSYQVQLEDGREISVQYTAFPPSPAGKHSEIRLQFHAGQIQAGDYVIVSGTYDPAQKVLLVQQKGESIETYPQKP